MKISFLPQRVICNAQDGMNLLETATKNNIYIDNDCGSFGICGKCKVKILAGNDYKIGNDELSLLLQSEITEGYRLACKYNPKNDIVVEIPSIKENVNRKSELFKLPENFMINDIYSKEEKAYGIAFDIGTTSVLGMLWNLKTGKNENVISKTNPQYSYGADVISRIMYAEESSENLNEIHMRIIGCMNDIVDDFLEKNINIERNDIKKVAVVGNTAMAHLVMGINPSSLARFPFEPEFLLGKFMKAKEAKINLENADFYLMSNLGGHVGSDITAGILATDIINIGKNILQIDIGTNGEIALVSNGQLSVCSTAAGPAFEGSTITHGMRAVDGAIESVGIYKGSNSNDSDGSNDKNYNKDGNENNNNNNNKNDNNNNNIDIIEVRTIGNGKPIGICGSGIIDAVAQLRVGNIIDKNGTIREPDDLLADGYSQEFVNRIRYRENKKEFVLFYSADEEKNDITISQKDIREVQLAKAAIYAGASILMKRMGVDIENLDEINIAGVFGTYIKIDSALAIGLLPNVPKEKIRYVGNSASVGISMAMLSEQKLNEAEKYLSIVKHMELSTDDFFQNEYIDALNFK